MYWRYQRNRSFYKRNIPVSAFSLMNSQRRSRLWSIRKDYGEPPREPKLSEFGITPEEISIIEKYNTKVNDFNKRQEKQKIFVAWVSGIATLIVLVLVGTYMSLLASPWSAIGFISFYLCIPISIGFGNKTGEKLTGPAKLAHPKTGNLSRYLSLKNSYPDAVDEYHILVQEEKKDKEERIKREFWLSLTGLEFENQMTNIFSRLGYEATKTRSTGDGGVDIILEDGGGNRTLVQCKAHKNQIGPHVVRDLFGVMSDERAQGGMLINLGGFTQGVRTFAEGKNIQLLDLEDVINLQGKASGVHN